MRVALVAGEASGDQLGAALIEALRARRPDCLFSGVAGPRMQAAGCAALADAGELAVMGLAEILGHLPRLWRLRRGLERALRAWQPDVFVGIDSPEFNLGLAARLKAGGLRTVQYVSPQVWAWRQGRVRTIARDCDLVLCLLPFEPAFYRKHAVRAVYVGHPLADQVPSLPDRSGARAALGLDPAAPILALLPGSRVGEVRHLGAVFLETVAWLRQRRPNLQFIAPLASPQTAAAFAAARACGVRMLDGQARLALQAADAALVTSGTATLEALLCRCPMVVAYRTSALSAALLRGLRLVRVSHFALPNLLAGERLVPEHFQEEARADRLGAGLLRALEDAPYRAGLLERFDGIHRELRQDGAAGAARAVLELVGGGGRTAP
ncbi:MAG: lipid-A-disaccharide synthase [Gammaproteobacteria bacterium]|nr:lipid-A-disaccharide synthase [Gammaproteobacteria bacterium]